MPSINTIFQQQAADIIIDLLNKDLISIRKSVFDHYEDKKQIFIYQLVSITKAEEICMLQQIIYPDETKFVYIFFDGRKKDWDIDIIQHLIDVVTEKLQIKEI